MRLAELTRKHGLKIQPFFPCSVEDCSLAVGEIIGHSSVKSAARMNNAVVIFVDTIENAEVVLENGIQVGDNFLPVSPLSTPAVTVTVSNVPPFIRDEAITRELSKHGKILSQVRKVSSGCKSPLLKHVVSHRRQVSMIPNDRSKGLNLAFKITVDDFDYVIYAKTNDFKCFSCGKEGHQSRACPEKNGSHKDQNQNQTQTGTEEGRGDKQDRQEGTGGIQKGKEKGSSVAKEVREEETTSGTQEVREEETSREHEVREEGASEVQKMKESTGGNVETGSEVGMEGDEEKLKAPQLKRKNEGNRGSSQAKKTATKGSGGAAECESRLEEDSESSQEEGSETSLEEGSDSSLDESPMKVYNEYLKSGRKVGHDNMKYFYSALEEVYGSTRAQRTEQ